MKNYLYICNYNENEKEFFNLEMEALFNKKIDGKYLFSNTYVEFSRSPFVKEGMEILYCNENVEGIIEYILKNEIKAEDFKVVYLKTGEKTCSYEERLKALYDIGYVIKGEPNFKEPKIIFGITKIKDMWYFGNFRKNDFHWHLHSEKPNSYSNSLSVRVARTLVNIAAGNDFNLSVVDPCCGVATVVIEGLDMGFNIKGYDINKVVCTQGRRNLEFFGFRDVVEGKDIKDINECFDVAIIDLPYNHFTPITREEQIDIINSARKIAKKLILITFENMDEIINNAGFVIKGEAKIPKGKFIRYIKVCF